MLVGVCCDVGELGIGARRQVHGLQFVQDVVEVGHQFHRTRGPLVGIYDLLGIEHDRHPRGESNVSSYRLFWCCATSFVFAWVMVGCR